MKSGRDRRISFRPHDLTFEFLVIINCDLFVLKSQ